MGEAGWGAHLAPTPEARKRELAEGEDYVPGHGLGPLAPAPATMTSLPCPVPGPDPSKAIFPNIAPVPSVVAAYQLGLSPATAAASDLPYSGPYGHLLPYPYAGPATPRDSYLPCQQPAAPSQPAQQEREAGKSGRRLFPPLGSCSCAPLNFVLAWLGAASGIQTLLGFHSDLGVGGGRRDGAGDKGEGRGRVDLGLFSRPTWFRFALV